MSKAAQRGLQRMLTVSSEREGLRAASRCASMAEARRAAEAAQLKDVQTMWQKFQKALVDERESYARLEESRKALVCDHHGPRRLNSDDAL